MYSSTDAVLDFFCAGDVAGFRAIKHHMDRQEVWSEQDFICAQISEWLSENKIDCESKQLPHPQREILVDLSTLIGQVPILFWMHPNRFPVFNDASLVKQLLNLMGDVDDEKVLGRIERCFEWDQHKIGFLLVNFYLHNLEGVRRPAIKLTAKGLYNIFEATGRLRILGKQDDIARAEARLMKMLVETGYIHNVLYLVECKKLKPCASFYKALAQLPQDWMARIEQFHRLPEYP
ncbi:hypothetical protein ACUZXZ_08345 [Pseudomonas juntendi]|uniref:hypothetical protein n=1 Tax=Pseudomonas juntendi TaxID=2666183 RepID=UPI001F29CF15|nr:hypothetical protein [Pseudomonas juntendi]MCO7057161.1 hypothetical protein [Pseudomonas juntendi]UJM14046.1 hypothetical protein L1P09_07630 [Pseudomonas juntendi]